ncbi:RagB/SusD family nutrient uptake outer membrane protein [Sediminitomix flava]|uniref:Putative outer membrane starch-binding protein n=1 Tax=Sediminitomix flava TaxID=379075 RepID=A0A315Z5U8_SEDFL|nr:RagB/SusD family nutrient uptake outer membrane protein [Sediminitomix flava]PWJ38579.1 putative outer membrane starch-binding protein [Sediminitomix flava]
MKKLKYILSSLLLVGLLSCSDEFLERQPSDSLPDDKVFDSYVTARAALVGAYDQMSVYSFEGLFLPIMSDIIGEDMMINSVNNWNWFVAVYQMEVLPNYTFADSPWWVAYKLIYDTNMIIRNASNIPDATPDQIDDLIGQARALRAYTYLKLVEVYAPAYAQNPQAPSVLLVEDIREIEEEDLPRASLDLVYDLIVDDLEQAIDLLDESDDKGFYDKRAARAILARAYLNMGMWEEALEMATLAVEGISLMSQSELMSGFMTRNAETIFSIAYTQNDNNIYLTIPSFYWPVAGYSSMRANDEFVKLFSSQDVRSGHFYKDNLIDPDRTMLLKFGHNQIVGNAERIVIRGAEMYLIIAECEAELGNYANAQEALFKVQNRADLTLQQSNAEGQALIDEILLERRKELFGEGFRWNDIKRRQLPFTRKGDHWVKFDFSAQDDDYYRLTFPIPQSEIDANNTLSGSDQNPGY